MQRIDAMLGQILGLNIDSIGESAVRRAVRDRMVACRIEDLERYITLLLSDAHERQELIEEVIVSETWFFRNAEALQTLVRLMMALRLSNPIRSILSIPCATGEEPYSVAIALAEGGFSSEHIHIDAMDVSRRALARAERGVYGTNAFRGDASRICAPYCHAVAGGQQLVPAIRSRVRFMHGNLVDPVMQAPTCGYDVIFCRNVLIYMNRPTQERVFATLDRLLAPAGYLFVGPAEGAIAEQYGFRMMDQHMAFVCQRLSEAPGLAIAAELHTPRRALRRLPVHAPSATPRIVTHPSSSGNAVSVHGVATPHLDGGDKTVEIGFAVAQRLADEGRLEEAIAACEAHVRHDGASADALYLLGLLHEARGASESALSYYRKALFLNPQHAAAATQLALQAQRRGDIESAGRLHERARRAESRRNS